MAEHDAVPRYVARRFKPDLLGVDNAEYALVESFYSYLTKLKLKSASFTYLPDPTEESRKGFIEQNKTDLVRLDKHAAGRKFLVGEHVTIADLYFYEVWTGLKCISDVAVSDLKNLANLYA